MEIPHTSGDRLNQQQQDAVDSLYQEINLLKDLDHEHIVEYLGYDRDDSEDVINIFLEYVSGGSISSRLARHGAFEEPVVRHFTRQILLGLEYLHDRSILHRVSRRHGSSYFGTIRLNSNTKSLSFQYRTSKEPTSLWKKMVSVKYQILAYRRRTIMKIHMTRTHTCRCEV